MKKEIYYEFEASKKRVIILTKAMEGKIKEKQIYVLNDTIKYGEIDLAIETIIDYVHYSDLILSEEMYTLLKKEFLVYKEYCSKECKEQFEQIKWGCFGANNDVGMCLGVYVPSIWKEKRRQKRKYFTLIRFLCVPLDKKAEEREKEDKRIPFDSVVAYINSDDYNASRDMFDDINDEFFSLVEDYEYDYICGQENLQELLKIVQKYDTDTMNPLVATLKSLIQAAMRFDTGVGFNFIGEKLQ